MDNKRSTNTRFDRELDRVLSELESLIEESTRPDNHFDRAIELNKEYLDDLKDGVQDQSDEYYEAFDARNITLESADEMTKGDQTDQMKRQQEAIQTAEPVVSEPPPARASQPDLSLASQYYIQRDQKKLGPVSGETILRNYRDGKVQASDEISENSDGPWSAIKDSELLSLS